jgi:predicted solute-binding protein
MLHGEQRELFDLDFCIPAECADRLGDGRADLGIVPVAELERLGLEVIPGTGIACEGPVRSILLVSQVPIGRIRTLASDASSRTSVMLTRVLLARKYGIEPQMIPMKPDLPAMLERADAALIIGDPALHLDPATLPFEVLDLGAEWTAFTGLPMVFAVWAARRGQVRPWMEEAFLASYRFGRDRLEEMVPEGAAVRGLSEELARYYLTHNIRFELGPREYNGMQTFLKYASELTTLKV